jgi:hypothetical protein
MGMSSLSGPDYVRNTQAGATRDSPALRWVAADESGWDGEQLYDRADRYLSIGSVAVDDGTAEEIVGQLRRDARLSQPPELKFTHFRDGSRLEVLAGLLGPGGGLASRAHVYLVDKHYFVTGKIIDLLLEEEATARGVNLHEGDRARQIAWTLFNEGPRALGIDGFNRIIATMVGFASGRNHDGSVVSVDALFEELRLAFGRAHRRRVSQILQDLLRTREHAECLPGREYRTMTLDALEEIFGGPSADTVGEAVVSREKLPGGPAVRVRRMRVEDADPAGQGTIVEGVTHAIQPQGIDGAIVATMTWTALQLGDKLAEMADAIARTIRVTSA